MTNKESPIILSDEQKQKIAKEFEKKKNDFDIKLSKLMLKEGVAVLSKMQYTNRGVFAMLDFEPLSPQSRELMEKRIKDGDSS